MEPEPVPSAAERAFLAHIIDDPADDLRRLVFADWLDEHDQGQRAMYLRARCALDGKRPEFGTYVDAIEQLRGCGYTVPPVPLPPGFSFRLDRHECREWSWLGGDGMRCGLPYSAEIHLGEREESLDAHLLAMGVSIPIDVTTVHELTVGLPILVDTTTVRGLIVGEGMPTNAPTLFASPVAAAVTLLKFMCSARGDSACPVVTALVASPMARSLTELCLYWGVPNAATADALTTAPFDALRVFGAISPGVSLEVYRRMVAAPWFVRLEELTASVLPGAFGPVTMPNLHSLGVSHPGNVVLETFARNAELPSLRRLYIHATNLHGVSAESLATLRCGELVELIIFMSIMRPADLRVLLAAPWAVRLEVLTIKIHDTHTPFKKIIDRSPCAKTLRIRRVG